MNRTNKCIAWHLNISHLPFKKIPHLSATKAKPNSETENKPLEQYAEPFSMNFQRKLKGEINTDRQKTTVNMYR